MCFEHSTQLGFESQPVPCVTPWSKFGALPLASLPRSTSTSVEHAATRNETGRMLANGLHSKAIGIALISVPDVCRHNAHKLRRQQSLLITALSSLNLPHCRSGICSCLSNPQQRIKQQTQTEPRNGISVQKAIVCQSRLAVQGHVITY
jgi:hypothetical protein